MNENLNNKECFQCHLCEKYFLKRDQMISHQTVHLNGKIFYCEKCPGKFFNETIFNKHVNDHETKPFACFDCPAIRLFATKIELEVHNKIHLEVARPIHNCKYCPKTYNRKDLLRDHELKHTGEKPFPCGICQFAAIQKSSLIRHLKLHRDPSSKLYINNKQFAS